MVKRLPVGWAAVLLVCGYSYAYAGDTVLLSVGQRSLRFDRTWSERNCVYLHNLINWAANASGGGPVQTECVTVGLDPDRDRVAMERAKASKRFPLHIEMVELIGGVIRLRIENWNQHDETDFKAAEWSLETTHSDGRLISAAERKTALQELLSRFFFSWLHPDGITNQRLIAGIPVSQVVGFDESGHVIDRATGKRPERDEAYQAFKLESARSKHPLWAAWEMVAVLGAGNILYGTRGVQSNVVQSSVEALTQKFTGTNLTRFDDNDTSVNGGSHAFFGSIYYSAGRSNGFGRLESFLFALAGSSAWEYLVETREVVSINDQIFTSASGAVIGEASHQMEQYAARGDGSLACKIVRNVFGYPSGIQRMIASRESVRAKDFDSAGFPADSWHSFALSATLTSIEDTGLGSSGRQDLDVSTELINIAGYGQEGRIEGWRNSTLYSRMQLAAGLSQTQMEQFFWSANVALAGYYRQGLQKEPSGDLKGYSFFIGPSSAYELSFDSVPGVVDHYAIAHVLGSTLDAGVYLRGALLRATVDVHGDFSQVRSLAFLNDYPKSQEKNDRLSMKSILYRKSDYFAFGISTDQRVSISKGGWEAGAELKYHRFESIEGLDRRQEMVTNDFHLSDQKGTRDLWVSYTLPSGRIKLAGGVLSRSWSSRIPAASLNWQRQSKELYARITRLF